MRMRRLAFVVMIGCGHGASSGPAPASGSGSGAALPKRPCVHAAEPVPASCIAAAARGKVLKDDAAAGLRIYQACEAESVVEGAYVAERVGNGRKTRAEMIELEKAHQKELWGLGIIQTSFAACGTSADDGGCIEVGFKQPNEDVPAVAADLARIFDLGDVCVAFRIDTGVAPM
jgi:hypothetical protein